MCYVFYVVNEGFNFVFICLEDIDVFIMFLVFSNEIGVFLFMKFGICMWIKVVDIVKVVVLFGLEVCKGVFGMYVFIGCDIVSVFVGKGKV